MNKSAKIPSSALRHFLRVLLLQPSGPSGGATIKPPGAVKLGAGAEFTSRGVPGCVGGQVGRGRRARACLQLRKRHVGGGGKSGTILLDSNIINYTVNKYTVPYIINEGSRQKERTLRNRNYLNFFSV